MMTTITSRITVNRLTLYRHDQVLFSLSNPLNTGRSFLRRGNDVIQTESGMFMFSDEQVLYRAAGEEEAREILTVLTDTVLDMHRAHPLRCITRRGKALAGVAVALVIAVFATCLWTGGKTAGMQYAREHDGMPLLATPPGHDAFPPVTAIRKRPAHSEALRVNVGAETDDLTRKAEAPLVVPTVAPTRAGTPPHMPAPQPVTRQTSPATALVRATDAAPAPAPAQPKPLTPAEFKAAQQALAEHLKQAAEKKTFTITLSSGHPRTLYVFADPDCQNCRLFEPVLLALSATVNVEIFPVTLVGKADTVKKVVPLLCAPAQARAILWRNLFDTGAGMRDLNHPQPALPECDDGRKALARNDLAMQLFHLPGTPTVIADDGRMVPFAVLRSTATLDTFLNTGPQPDSQERPATQEQP